MTSTLTFDASSDPILQRRRAIQDVAASSLRRRRVYSKIAVGVCWVFLGIAIVPLVAVVVYVVIKGLPAWNVDFFTQVTVPEGIPGGGAWNAIVGTVEIGVISTAAAVPLGLTCGLFLAESDGKIAAAVRFIADVMTGVPSITIGIFGYLAIVRNFGYSGLAGAFAIGIVMLPVIIRAGETAFRGVPRSLNEAALALGARRSTVAPLLLTIFGSEYMQWNPTKVMDALPLVIYNNSSQPYANLVQIAWGAALLLMVVVLLLSIGSRVTAAVLQRERR